MRKQDLMCQRFGRLRVDHCHLTGEVRGLLCNGCNLLLGRFEQRRDLILKYLEAK